MPEATIASMVASTLCSVSLMPESQEFHPIGGVGGSAGRSWWADAHAACVAATRPTRPSTAMIDGSGKRTGRLLGSGPVQPELTDSSCADAWEFVCLRGGPVLRGRNWLDHHRND